MEIERTTIPDAVSGRIMGMISSGELKPGESLPPQRQLAEEMGIGLSSFREGIRPLVARGVLEVRPGRGTFVTDDLSKVAAKKLGLGFKLEGRVSRELLEVRRILELEAVALAAERATAAEIAQIVELLAQMQEAVRQQDWRTLEGIDPGFHLSIVKAAHNDILSRLMESLYDLFRQLVEDTPYGESNFESHNLLLRALKEQDPERARAAMSDILEDTRRSLQLDA